MDVTKFKVGKNPEKDFYKTAAVERLKAGTNPSLSALPSYSDPKRAEGPLPEFDYLRNQAQQRANQNLQSSTEAIGRRFAQLGGGPGAGTQLKIEQAARTEAGKTAEEAMGSINSQEMAEKQRRYEREQDVGFKKADLDFRNRQQQFNESVAAFDQGSKLKQLDLAQMEFDRDSETLNWNKALSAAEAGNKTALADFLQFGVNEESLRANQAKGRPFWKKFFDPAGIALKGGGRVGYQQPAQPRDADGMF